jgi:GDPmannose 4,6-dehydratase
MNAIIFGANGQDGYYLSNLLSLQKIRVIAVSRNGNGIIGDVSDLAFVEALIKNHQPDYIFHFAANSTTNHSALFDNHAAISTGTLNILESVRLYCPGARVFLSGSAMQFRNEGLPINEETEFEAGSAYAASRIYSVYMGRYYRNKFNTKVFCGYFFNHDSPGRSEQHVNKKITQAATRIAAGSMEKLELGNIDVKKEFNFAGDFMEAVWKLVNQDNLSEAVIGSGIAYSIKEWLEYCFNKIGKNWKDFVAIRQNFEPEYNILVSDPGRIMQLGWKPKVGFTELADMMMNE